MRSLRNLWLGCGAFLAGVQLQAVTPAEPPAIPPPPVAQENGSESSPATGAESNPAEANPPAEPAADTNPYQAITIRNAFGLKDPPPPPPPPQQTNPPVNIGALKITLLTTLMGKRAAFVLENGRTNILSDLLREGERDRSITNLEVLEIDDKARAVRVNYGGLELKLDFVNNGIRPPTNMVLAGGSPGMARPGFPTPGFTAPGQVLTSPQTGFTPPAIQAGSTGFRSGVRSLPARPTRLTNPGGRGMSQPTVSQPTLTPQQELIVMQEQQKLAARQGIQMPPPPPMPGFQGSPGAASGGPPALPGQQ